MFWNSEVVAAFSVSAVLTFFVSATLLLIYVAKKGFLRVGSTRKSGSTLLPQECRPQVLTPVELMPLKIDKVTL